MNASMTRSYRADNVEAAYEQFKATWPSDKCALCHRERTPIASNAHFNVVPNDFPYYTYDGKVVTEHLLVIPHEHIYAMSECDEKARQELTDIISHYEHSNYNTYIRAPGNDRRSVAHYHVHLIKLGEDDV